MDICTSCGAANAEESRFCATCGAALGTACANCGANLPEDAQFCPACGTRTAPAPEVERQRKVISVLFADLVGYTARSETTDAEDVRELLERYYARASAEVERFGGFVEKFIGDAVMAVFGAPVSRGDDAERAVRAALQIPVAIEALNLEMPGADLQRTRGRQHGRGRRGARPRRGKARPWSLATWSTRRHDCNRRRRPGRVLVGDETYRVTHRSIRYEAVEPIIAKNKRDPVTAWLAVEPISGARRNAPTTHRSSAGRTSSTCWATCGNGWCAAGAPTW